MCECEHEWDQYVPSVPPLPQPPPTALSAMLNPVDLCTCSWNPLRVQLVRCGWLFWCAPKGVYIAIMLTCPQHPRTCILCILCTYVYDSNIECLCGGTERHLLVLDSFHRHLLNQLIMCLLSVCKCSWSSFQCGKVPCTVHTQAHDIQILTVTTLRSNKLI